jgi:hypothetical protein
LIFFLVAAPLLAQESTVAVAVEPELVAFVPAWFVSEWECLPQVQDDRSRSAAVQTCPSPTDT